MLALIDGKKIIHRLTIKPTMPNLLTELELPTQ